MLDHSTVGCKVTPQDCDSTVGSDGIMEGTDNVLPLQSDSGAVSVTFIIETVALQFIQILTQGFSGNGQNIQKEHGADFLHDPGNTAGIVEILCRPSACRTDIKQIMGASVQPIKHFRVKVDPKFVGDGRNVQKGIGRTRNGCTKQIS